MRDYIKSMPNPFSGCLFRNIHNKPLTPRNIQDYFHARAVETGVIKPYSPPCSRCRGETVRFRGKQIGYKCRECGGVDWASKRSHAGRAGVRYGVNPHEIRDLGRSRWKASGADLTVAEVIMGHYVDPNFYDKMKYTPGYAFQEYREALRWLNVVSEGPERVDRASVDAELEKQRQRNEKLTQDLVSLRQNVTEIQRTMDELKREVERKNK